MNAGKSGVWEATSEGLGAGARRLEQHPLNHTEIPGPVLSGLVARFGFGYGHVDVLAQQAYRPVFLMALWTVTHPRVNPKGFSGHACGNPLRYALMGRPGPNTLRRGFLGLLRGCGISALAPPLVPTQMLRPDRRQAASGRLQLQNRSLRSPGTTHPTVSTVGWRAPDPLSVKINRQALPLCRTAFSSCHMRPREFLLLDGAHVAQAAVRTVLTGLGQAEVKRLLQGWG